MSTQYPYDGDIYYPSAPVAEIKISANAASGSIKETTLSALIDSGADATMLPEDLLIQLGAQRLDRRRSRGIYGEARIVNIYLVDIQIGTLTIPSIKTVGVSTADEPLIGRDVLNQLIVTLDGIGGVTEIS